MNKLMLATAMVTALSSGSLMAKEWKEVRIGVEGAYPLLLDRAERRGERL